MNAENAGSLDSYLDILHLIDKAQSSPIAIKLSVYDAFVNCFLKGTTYLELRWNPYKRSQDFDLDFDRLIIAARAGMEKAMVNFGIEGDMLLCLGRDISEQANRAIFKKALKYQGKGVRGIDIAGPESIELPGYMEEFYVEANRKGLITTIHCGEEFKDTTEQELETILTKYRPRRIGHGVQMARFPGLLRMAANQGVIFELCLTSNLATKVVRDHVEFANVVKALVNAGCQYEICTDGTFSLDTDITREHERFQRALRHTTFSPR